MSIDLKALQGRAIQEINQAKSRPELERIRIKYLGRKGEIAQITNSIPQLSLEDRPEVGAFINRLKKNLLDLIEKRFAELSESKEEKAKYIDINLPGIYREQGTKHPINAVIEQICEIFSNMGFGIAEGPEIETEFNNFTALNIPLEHPSRDVFDTFYIKPQATSHKPQAKDKEGRKEACSLQPVACSRLLLRSHTSPVQIRVMKKHKPPLAVVVPGKVYRPDAPDASHSFMFHQIEGFLVDKEVRFSHLKGILSIFAKEFFGQKTKMRFRPHFFPFTEPSAEVDISCVLCRSNQTPGGGREAKPVTSNQKKHCRVCGGKGWLEILGCGMIHPNVFKHVRYDTKKYTGFAFGMGIERMAMLKYGINDIRIFFENDLRFLRQF